VTQTLGDTIVTPAMIASLDAQSIDRRVDAFTKKHGRAPSEQSTIREWCMISRRCSDHMKLISTFVAPYRPEHKQTINKTFVQLCVNSVHHALSIVEAQTPRDWTAGYAVDATKQCLKTPSESNRSRAYQCAIHADNAARLAESNSINPNVIQALNACGWAARAAADQFDDCLFYATACVRTIENNLGMSVFIADTSLVNLFNQQDS